MPFEIIILSMKTLKYAVQRLDILNFIIKFELTYHALNR